MYVCVYIYSPPSSRVSSPRLSSSRQGAGRGARRRARGPRGVACFRDGRLVC